MINADSFIFVVSERSSFIAGVGSEEKVLCALNSILPHHLLKLNFLFPTEGKQ